MASPRAKISSCNNFTPESREALVKVRAKNPAIKTLKKMKKIGFYNILVSDLEPYYTHIQFSVQMGLKVGSVYKTG